MLRREPEPVVWVRLMPTVHRPPGPSSVKVTQVLFSPDGRHILAVDEDGVIWTAPLLNEAEDMFQTLRPAWKRMVRPQS